MTKTDALRRFFLSCFYTPAKNSTTTVAKKRISTSLRDDIPDDQPSSKTQELHHEEDQDSDNTASSPTSSSTHAAAALSTATVNPRPSKTMVIGTIFGQRRGHVWFCIQHDRLSTKPTLLLEMSIPTCQLVKEMNYGFVRIALECGDNGLELGSCPLRSVPLWTLFCNGRKLGFAVKRRANEQTRKILKTMESITVGAGVLPSGFGALDDEEIMYMRANYEHVVGSLDCESFHLINPDQCPGQELSVFLMRSK